MLGPAAAARESRESDDDGGSGREGGVAGTGRAQAGPPRQSEDSFALERLLAEPATRRAIGFSETPILSFFLVTLCLSNDEIDVLGKVEEAFRERGMLYRMVGLHRVDSLFSVCLDAGELMPPLPSLRRRDRYFPPHGDWRTPRGGASLGQHAQFLVIFPLSSCAFRALHGWAAQWVRRSTRPVLTALALAPASLALFALQLLATLSGVAALLCYFIFGTLFTMCVYGDSKVLTRPVLSAAPGLLRRMAEGRQLFLKNGRMVASLSHR